MSIKTPRLTRDRCGVFYIRLVVPKALRADIGKSELRRSLRTKDCSIAKQRALTLNLALEAALTNPKISDFEHLFNSPEVTTRKAMTIDFERGFFHADTPEEGQALQSIVASYASNRANAVKEQITEIMPVNKCGILKGKTDIQIAALQHQARAEQGRELTLLEGIAGKLLPQAKPQQIGKPFTEATELYLVERKLGKVCKSQPTDGLI